MAHINPVWPNDGDPGWGDTLNANFGTMTNQINTHDDLIATLATGSAPASATTSTQGVIRLAGDLAGTASSPTLVNSATTRSHLGLAAIAASGSATDLSTGTVAPARLGSGTPAAGKYVDGTGVWTTLPSGGGGTTITYNVLRPESYGAVADGTTDDGGAWTSALAAAAANSGAGFGIRTIVRGTAGKTYRIKTTITVPTAAGVDVDLNGSIMQGPITGYAPINSGNNPSVPTATDVTNQTSGACFADAGGTGTIYLLKFRNGTFSGFRYGIESICYAWAHPIFENLNFTGCNIGIFCYQGAQDHTVLNCISNDSPVYVAAATCFASGHPYASLDNSFCDQLLWDSAPWARSISAVNATFDTWFQAAIIRPTTASVTSSGSHVFGFTDADSLAVTGRVVYIPMRANRAMFGPDFRRLTAQSCPRGTILIANPTQAEIKNFSGELMFASGAKSMVVILLDNGNSGDGVIENIDALNTTGTSLYGVEVRSGSNSGGVFDYSGWYASNVQGPGWSRDDPYNGAFSHPAMFMRARHVARQYYSKTISTTTLTNVDTLTFTTPSNAQTVAFRAVIFYAVDSTSHGARFTINGPTASYIDYRVEQSLTTTSRAFNEGLGSYQLPSATPATSATTAGNVAIIEGQVRTTASGAFTIQAAADTSGTVTVKQGSTLEYIYTSV